MAVSNPIRLPRNSWEDEAIRWSVCIAMIKNLKCRKGGELVLNLQGRRPAIHRRGDRDRAEGQDGKYKEGK